MLAPAFSFFGHSVHTSRQERTSSSMTSTQFNRPELAGSETLDELRSTLVMCLGQRMNERRSAPDQIFNGRVVLEQRGNARCRFFTSPSWARVHWAPYTLAAAEARWRRRQRFGRLANTS